MATRTQVPIENLEQYLIDHPEPAIVEFWRPGCGVCARLASIINRAVPDLDVPIIQVRISQYHPVLERFEISVTPTCLLVVNGEEKSRLIGFMTSRQMIQWPRTILQLVGRGLE